MKTFQRVPPQSTEYRELFAFGAASSEVQTEANKSELQVSFSDSYYCQKLCTWVGTVTAPIPHGVLTLQPGAPSPRHSQHPAAQGRATVLWYLQPSSSPQTAVQSNTTTWSTLQYSQVTIYTTQHQESISPDTKCYFTPAAKIRETSSTKGSIWLLRTNKL